MRIKFLAPWLLIFLTTAGVKAAGDDTPAWLQQAAKMSVPAYEKDLPAVVLQREQHVTVSDDGRVTTVTLFAIRILIREGRDYAAATEYYENDAGKVRELRGWLIKPSGQVKKYGKDETIDAVEDPNDIYNESRLKMIDASKDADAGAVFGYQATIEERPIFSQDVWSFQNRLPAITSRYTLTLPAGWSAKSVTFNHAKIEPTISGSTYTWELQNLPPIAPEPSSPKVSSVAPRLAVSYFPPGDTQSTNFKTFSNWPEVSFWLTQLHDPQATANDALSEKTRQLTANARTELEKIRAVGSFVQTIRYIAIAIGVSRGGGMRPRLATEVFAKSYGDCKDKANLMRAMLKVLGITAYPVAIYSGDADYVREEWASPNQFNHCIIAIKVSDETQAATVLTHPKLGRLLIFDATDDDTPVGDLPEQEQGSLALIIAGEAGSLVRMPVTSPETNLLDRQVEASLDASGALTAAIREQATGRWAVAYRSEFRHLPLADYQKTIEGWITAGATGAKLSKIDPRDDSSAGRFDLNIDFTASAYAQLMQNRLLVFKPAIVSRREALTLTNSRRLQPIVLTAKTYSETVKVKIPSGFDVDEMPDAVNLKTSFGTYATTYEVKDGQLIFTRKLLQNAAIIPVDQYNSVRSFYERIRAAEQAPVVLARK
jgi:transglutaminase-like putative cysteine protease